MLFKYILPGISWAIFILILSGLPSDTISEVDFFQPDKLVHFGEHALLVLFLTVGLKRQHSFIKLRCNAFTISLIASIIYGIVIELIQSILFQGRESDFFDIAANILGALFGYVLFKVIYGNTRLKAS